MQIRMQGMCHIEKSLIYWKSNRQRAIFAQFAAQKLRDGTGRHQRRLHQMGVGCGTSMVTRRSGLALV